eukprot:12783358-Prorocentrum_lima.AAC.1
MSTRTSPFHGCLGRTSATLCARETSWRMRAGRLGDIGRGRSDVGWWTVDGGWIDRRMVDG